MQIVLCPCIALDSQQTIRDRRRLKDQWVQYNNLSATIKLGMQISMAAVELIIFSVVGIKMPSIKW